jgi:hypothetical protein
VSDEQVAEVLAFVKAAKRVGRAKPSEVDEYLRRGSGAFSSHGLLRCAPNLRVRGFHRLLAVSWTSGSATSQ